MGAPKGSHNSLETEFKRGTTPWNKGISCSKQIKEKLKKGMIKVHKEGRAGGFKKGHLFYPGGEEKWFKKGQESWNKGILCSKETKEKIRVSRKNKILKQGFYHSKKSRQKIRNYLLNQPLNVLKKRLSHMKKSSLEIQFESIIKKYNLPYKFVGDGNFFIEQKCPDFINCNGKKIAIEIYYTYFKTCYKNGIENWKNERQKIFSKYGWKLIFFDETQVNENYILDTLKEVI